MKINSGPLKLAESAIESGLAVCADHKGELTSCDSNGGKNLAPLPHMYGPIVCVSCPEGTAAVAYPLEAELISNKSIRSARIALVVPVVGRPVIMSADRRRLYPDTRAATLIDLGLRALGLTTARPTLPLIGLLDRIWLDRVMAAVLDSDLGRPPEWGSLAALHPAMPRCTDPDQLAVVRALFHTRWETLRLRIVAADIRWPGMPPTVAHWLDDGSVSRWCVADTPDPAPILDDLDELLDPAVAERLRASLAPSLPISRRPAGNSGHGRQQ